MDGLDDGALADADTSAHGRAVRHLGDVEAEVGGRRWKEQMPALIRQIRARAQPLHVLVTVRGVADEDHARELAVANRDLLVHAERRVLIPNRLGAVVVDVSSGEHLDADDLELGRLHRALVGRAAATGDRGREHLALLEERRDESITDAAMLDALPDGENVGVRRLHEVVDDDAALDRQAGLSTEIHARPDPGSDDDEVRIELLAAREFHSGRAPIAANRRRALAQHHADAKLLHLRHQESAARRIELPFHEGPHQVDDGHATALHLETARRLEAEQATADDDGFGVGTRSLEQLARVVERAEGEDAFLVETFDWRHPRRAARREQQRVVRRHAPVVTRDGLAAPGRRR